MKQEVTLKDIEAAESRIRKHVPPTPLEFSPRLSQITKSEVYLKLEVFQPIRVFKIRGAVNKILSLPDSSVRRGVITASSGNHGLAVAYASRVFGIDATVCVPTNANPQKVAAIEEQGAKIIRSGASYDDTYLSARSIATRRHLTFLHAFDDREVVAGQGTCGLEIAQQASDLGSAVVSIGGGGLISGISIALKSLLDGVSVYGVQTTASPSMYESVRLGKRSAVKRRPTIADGMQATPGRLTFDIVSKFVDSIALVSDAEIEDAMIDLMLATRVLVEPSGAAPLAAVKNSLKLHDGRKVVLVVSGGNVAFSLLTRLLRSKRITSGSS